MIEIIQVVLLMVIGVLGFGVMVGARLARARAVRQGQTASNSTRPPAIHDTGTWIGTAAEAYPPTQPTPY